MSKPPSVPERVPALQEALEAVDTVLEHVKASRKKIDSLRGVRPVVFDKDRISLPDPFPPPGRKAS